MLRFLSKFLGSNEQELNKFRSSVVKINALEADLEKLSAEELKNKTREFKERLGKNQTLDDILPEAFAAVREAAKRTIGQRHFDVQLMGGIVLHQGKIAEMKTGEGKTLVATLPLYLNALEEKGAYLVTVNDFLAKFQAQWMGKIYHALGLTVGAIGHEQSFVYTAEPQEVEDKTWEHLMPVSRRDAYLADITYGTNNEFGFDYLRDNMAVDPSQISQRELHFAIVDEVDSILIDEARTPLIISAPAQESTNLYQRFAELVPRLKPDDYEIDEKARAVSIKDSGIEKIEQWLAIENLYAPENVTLVHHLEEALKAEYLFKKDKDYVTRDNEIVIVDEFTGRLMFGRRYSEGLHQAIEAKEKVEVQRESETLATISFQNLFRLFKKLAGMTGTAATEAEEFYKIYSLEVVSIPTNLPMVRSDHNDRIYKNEAAKLQAIVEEVKKRNGLGQPLLIGTISIEKNEKLSRLLSQHGIKHNLLNAKNHENEARTIAQAGRINAVTLATNIAGRGIDVILGGTPKIKLKVKSSKLKVDAEDSKSENETGLISLTKDHRTTEEWQREHEKVVELGGLCVIGTERHESRRIDNQLRGRSGRQGDPGESVFFVSMDDDLMRIFGGERLKNMMERLGLPDNLPIENKLISRSIEQAQRKVESHNFDIRKHLVEYDDVLNKHRTAIYSKRKNILAMKGKNRDNEIVELHEEIMALLSEDEKKEYAKKIEKYNLEICREVEKRIYLSVIDRFWIEHLNAIDELRTGIGLRGYGQKDPLVEYKQAAYFLFQNLIRAIENQVVEIILKFELDVGQARLLAPERSDGGQAQFLSQQQSAIPKKAIETGAEEETSGQAIEETAENKGGTTITVRKRGEAPTQETTFSAIKKVGRNEPCPCGSGKKYKKCHGR